MSSPAFATARKLSGLIEKYFKYAGEESPNKKRSANAAKCKTARKKKAPLPESNPVTISGLAFFLGFNSRGEFEDYEQNGQFATLLKRARLRIEAVYEKKLHRAATAGVIFALKSLGWDKGNDNKTGTPKTLQIEFIETGFQPPGSETEVMI